MISLFRNVLRLFIKTRKITAFSNIILGYISFPKKIHYCKWNRISGKVIIGEGISLQRVNISGNVQIGKYTSINGPNTFLVGARSGIKIGSFCSIARNVQIQAIYHNYNRVTTYSIIKSFFKEYDVEEFIEKGIIDIQDDVWIGANSVILSGVTIGRGAIIAAGSVVTKDVRPYSIVAGNPAKEIKQRFSSEIVTYLEESQWWKWDDNQIKENKDFFKKNLLSELL